MAQDIDELSLQEIAATLWSRRGLVAGLTVLFTAVAVTFALLAPVTFETSTLLAPVDPNGAGSGKLGRAGALLSQFSGLASATGLSLGGGSAKDESVATLQSASLTRAFIDDNKLLPVLFADDWDEQAQKWKKLDPDKVPTLWKAERKFRKKVRSVDEDKKTGLIMLTIEWTDPKLAADWANQLVERTNRTLRDQAIEVSKRNLDYLYAQLSKTSIVEMQQALYSLIETEIKKIMVAQGNNEYAFKVIDPAQVPEEKSAPKRTLITGLGAFAGLMLGIVLSLLLPRRRD